MYTCISINVRKGSFARETCNVQPNIPPEFYLLINLFIYIYLFATYMDFS